MSQINVPASAGSLPPEVVEAVTVDNVDVTVSAISQTAPTDVTASGHKFVVNGDNGIQTVSIPTVSSNAWQIRFSRGEITTSDGLGQTRTILTFGTATNSVITLQILVAGFSTDNLGVGGYTTASVINVAGVASLIDTPDIIVQNSVGLEAATFTVSTVGANLIIQVTGVAGKTIDWTACTPGIVSS